MVLRSWKTFCGKSTYIWSCRNTLLSSWSWKVLFLSLHSIQWHTIRLTSAWQIPFIPLCSPCIQLCGMEKKHRVRLVSLKHLPPFFLPCFLPHSLLPPTSFSTCLPLLHLRSDPSPPLSLQDALTVVHYHFLINLAWFIIFCVGMRSAGQVGGGRRYPTHFSKSVCLSGSPATPCQQRSVCVCLCVVCLPPLHTAYHSVTVWPK